MSAAVSNLVMAVLERTLVDGRWATVEQLAKETGYAANTLRLALNRHPLADWRPVHGRHEHAGAPVKEWGLQVLKAKRRHKLDPDHFPGVRKMVKAEVGHV